GAAPSAPQEPGEDYSSMGIDYASADEEMVSNSQALDIYQTQSEPLRNAPEVPVSNKVESEMPDIAPAPSKTPADTGVEATTGHQAFVGGLATPPSAVPPAKKAAPVPDEEPLDISAPQAPAPPPPKPKQ